MPSESTIILPFPATAAIFDRDEGLRTIVSSEGGELVLPVAVPGWVGPAKVEDLPRALAWLGTGEAGALACGLVLAGEEISDETVRALPPRLTRSVALVRCPRLTNAAVRRLGELGLESLALIDCTGISSGLEHLDPSKITRLWLGGCRRFTARTLKCVHRFRSLELLDLRGGLASRGLLRWLGPLERLAHLDLSEARSLGPLRVLEGLPLLRTLALRHAVITEGLLHGIGRLRALRELDLSHGRVQAPAKSWRRIRRVEQLRACGLEPGARLDWLEGIAELEGLSRLDLRGSSLPARAFERLRAALPRVEILCDPPTASSRGGAAWGSLDRGGAIREEGVEGPFRPWAALRIEDLYAVVPDERNQPIGIAKRLDLGAIAREIDPSLVIAFLARDQPADRVLVALTFLPELVHHHDLRARALTSELVGRLALLFDDERRESWRWGGPAQRAELVVGPLAMRACLDLLRWRRRAGPEEEPAESEVLERLVASALRLDRTIVEQFACYLLELPAADLQIGELCALLEGVVLDDGRPARFRFEALASLEQIVERLPAAVRSPALTTLSRVCDRLVASAADPGADVWFRREARRKLAEVAPERLVALRESGEIETRDLPPFAALAGHLGVDLEKATTAAVETDPAGLLQALRSDDLDRVFSALAVAPFVGSQEDARGFAEAIAELVGRHDRLVLGPEWFAGRLGDLAAERLTALIRGRGLEPTLLGLAIEAAIRQPVDESQTAPPGLLTVILAVPPGDVAVTARVSAAFLDRTRPAEERFALYLASTRVRSEHGLAPLLDEQEDPELRALIGTIGSFSAAELEAIADTSVEPWLPRRMLPVSRPADKVPPEWLLTTLRTARHQLPLRAAAQALVSRLLPDDATPEQVAAAAALLRELEVAPALRALLDHEGPSRSLGRDAGARWLATLGEAEDEERLASQMANHAAWYSLERLATLRTPLDRVLAVCASDSVSDGVESDLAPLIRLGFGAERARRLEARAFVFLARRHQLADRAALAARAAAQAAKLDPLNLDALRLLRDLSG